MPANTAGNRPFPHAKTGISANKPFAKRY